MTEGNTLFSSITFSDQNWIVKIYEYQYVLSVLIFIQPPTFFEWYDVVVGRFGFQTITLVLVNGSLWNL